MAPLNDDLGPQPRSLSRFGVLAGTATRHRRHPSCLELPAATNFSQAFRGMKGVAAQGFRGCSRVPPETVESPMLSVNVSEVGSRLL